METTFDTLTPLEPDRGWPEFLAPDPLRPAAPPPPTPPPAGSGDGRAGGPGVSPWSRARRAAGLLTLALVAGTAGAAVTRVLDDPATMAAPAPAAASDSPVVGASRLAGESLDVAGVVAAVEPAVVSIEVDYGAGRFGATGAGTGVILTADGDILTNAHVVEGASRIRVAPSGESQSRTAELVGLDRAADLALLHLPGTSGLPTASLGRSSDAQVGDDVVAIGNALALRGGPTVTRGIISALDRSLESETGTMTGLIQTDASISSGNSGGPLVNASGQVIAINTAVATGGRASAAENIGFAIPIDRALPVVERLRGGIPAPDLAYLGVRSTDPADGSRGASIVSVEPGSPAADAGLRPGDLVTRVAGKAVAGAAELGGRIAEHQPGERVVVSLLRDGKAMDLEVSLATRSSSDG